MKNLILIILVIMACGCKKEPIEPIQPLNTLIVDFEIEYLYANKWNCEVKITNNSKNYDSIVWFENGQVYYNNELTWQKKYIKSEGNVDLMLKGYQDGESKKITKIVDVFYFD